ncbi:hypothetical protein ACTXT7_015937, partial [Hymenolepis weldensis]
VFQLYSSYCADTQLEFDKPPGHSYALVVDHYHDVLKRDNNSLKQENAQMSASFIPSLLLIKVLVHLLLSFAQIFLTPCPCANASSFELLEQAARVIYQNITIPNEYYILGTARLVINCYTLELLRPVRVFHRPGENAPYIVELYVVTDEKFKLHLSPISSFSHDIVQVVTRVNNIFKVVNSLYSRFNVQFVIVGLEIWEKNRVNLEAEDHFIRTLASFKRTEVSTRHDCLFAILGDDDQTSTTRGRANSQVMCKYSSCVSFVRVSRFTSPLAARYHCCHTALMGTIP